MASAILFVYGIVALFLAINALRAPSPPTSRFPALWLPAVALAEAPWIWLMVRVLISLGLMALGALDQAIGQGGLLMVIAAQVAQMELIRRSGKSARQLSQKRAPAAWWERLTGWPFRIPEDVERLTDVEYAPGLLLDLYRPKQLAEPRPCLIYVHGGSWGSGNPRLQFRPVIHYLASRGWVVAAIRYPLSPAATFPEHLVGVKRSVVWARRQGLGYGVDPDRVAIAGGSAGAHLASLTALTPGQHQPGFEEADTSVRAAVVLYGIYDFVNRNRTRFDWPVIPFRVMKASLTEAPDRYREASPLDQIHQAAPPILVVHGTHDSLVPPAEGIVFASAMEAAGAPTELLEVKWAQHAFDVIAGARSRALAVRVERFLDSSMAAADPVQNGSSPKQTDPTAQPPTRHHETMQQLAVGTEKGGYFLTKEGDWSVRGPVFPGWKVSAFGTAADGTYLAALGSNWFGASVHRSSDLEGWEQVENGPSYPKEPGSEQSGRKLNQIWKFHTAGERTYAGVDEAGLFYSDDAGVTWAPVEALNEHPSRSAWSPGAGGLCAHHVLTDGERIWVGISAVGVFRSDDGGKSFGRFDTGVTPTVTLEEDGTGTNGWCVHGLVADPSNPDRIWRQDHQGVYRTDDGGDHWDRIETGLPSKFGFSIGRDHASKTLFVVPLESDENRLPVGGRLAAYRSSDDGDSWEQAGTGWPVAQQFTGVLRNAMALDQGGGVALGTTGGRVYLTEDVGDTWQELPFTFPRILVVAPL